MLTKQDVKKISRKLSAEVMGLADSGLDEEISSITYCSCREDLGVRTVLRRYIDIEYVFGEYYEAEEGSALFQFVCSLEEIPLLEEEQELILYREE